MLRYLRTLSGHLWGVSTLWLLALALCLFGWSLLGGVSGSRLAERVAHAGAVASTELAQGLLRADTRALAPQVRALLVRQDVGFAWLRLRDAQGRTVAAAGRLTAVGGGLPLSDTLRRQVYALISTEHRVPLVHGGIEVGSLEFGLLIGGGSLGDTGGQVALGLLALLIGVPALLLLTLRLRTVLLADWASSGRAVAHTAATRVSAARLAPQAQPVLSPAAGELMAVFDRGGVVVDRNQMVRDLNEQAERMTGWQRDQAFGLPFSGVVVLTQADAPDAPAQLPLEDCIRGRRERVQGRYVLNARDGTRHDVDIDAGPIRDSAGRVGGVLLSLRKVEKLAGALQRVAPASALAQRQTPGELSQMLLDQVLDCVITIDSQDRIQFANGRALENLGYSLTELRGQHISHVLPVPFLRESRLRVADFALTLAGTPGATVVARRRDGSQYGATLVVHPVSFQGRQGYVVTLRPAAGPAEAVALPPPLLRILESTPEEAYVVNPDSLELIAGNLPAQRNLGFSAEQLAKMTLLRLCPRLLPDTLRERINSLRNGMADRLEYHTWHQRADGSDYEVQARLSLWSGEGGPLLLLVAQDVAAAAATRPEVAHRDEKLDFLGYHDALTGLPSRPLFMDRLQQAIARSSRTRNPFAVVHLAMSDFGEVNQRYGYEIGDLLLKAVADRLSSIIRPADTAARLGGDEFTLLVTALEERQAIMHVLKRLQQALSAPLRAGAHDIAVRACMGITIYPDDAATPDLLMRHAGHALREARAKGPGEASLYQVSSAAKVEIFDIAEELREAQARGELSIELQPLNDVRARLVIGAEVLLAWRYPGAGLLRTAAQLRQASGNTQLAEALGLWAVEQACEQQANWRNLELHTLPLLVNLSALPLAGRRGAQALRGLLARHRVPPQQLIVMVNAAQLESLLSDGDSALPVLRDLGLRIGVNDVDPARMDLLRRADVDVVQLTPGVTAGLPGSREAADRTAAIIQAGQRIGAQIFASGVERAEQREALLALGCHFQQGRLLGEPLAPREFARYLVRAEMGAV